MKISLEPSNKEKPKKGKVLVSEPFLNDPFFKRVVVLLCDFDETGAFGFTLNNYVNDIKISQVISDFPEFNTKICIGGPVKRNNLFYIHTKGDLIPGSKEIMPGLYFGGDYEKIIEAIKTHKITPNDIRFFIGYSGWSAGQLEDEIESKSWFVTDIDPKTVMDTTTDNLWKKVLSNMGTKEKIISNIPENHELN